MVAIGIGVGVVFGGAVPAPFTPLDLSPALWLDASDATTITASSGAVSEWRDKSGNARHVSQGTAAAQPTTEAATLNGLNVLSFDGGDSLNRASFTMTTRTLFIVADATGTPVGAHGALFRHGATMPTVVLRHNGTNRDAVLYFNKTGESLAVTSVSGLSSPHQLTGRYTDNSAAIVRLNGSQIGSLAVSSGAQTDITGTLQIAGDASASFRFVGTIAEVIAYDSALSNTDMADVETYLATKWGTP